MVSARWSSAKMKTTLGRSAGGAPAEAAPPSEAEQLIEAVKALHPDELSPREALEALYALKAKLPKAD